MADPIKILIQTIVKGEQDVRSMADVIDSGFKRGKLAVEAFDAATGAGEKSVRNLSFGVKDLVAAYLSISAAKAAFSGMVEILKQGEQAQFSMTASVQAANREFQNTGSLTYWEGTVKDLSKELVIYSESALKGAVSRTVDMTKRLGLSADQMKVLITRTADLSAGKTDLQGGIERVTSALRGEAEASEYLGLTLNEKYVMAWYEAHGAHEKVWQDLTELEKAQVRYQVFLEQTSGVQGRAAASAKTFRGALQLVEKAIDDSVNNNRDLSESMGEVAQFIRENASSIGEMASTLITVTARVAEFALKWRDLLIGLAGVYGVVKGVQLLSSVITGLSAAMNVLRATRSASAMIELATASRQALVAGVPLSAWLSGGLAVAAAMAAAELLVLAAAEKEIQKWTDAAAQAEKERVKIREQANVKARELGKSLGLNINSMEEFNEALRTNDIVFNKATGSYEQGAGAYKGYRGEVQLTERAMEKLKDTLQEVGKGYGLLESKTSAYFDFAAEKARALSKDERKGTLDALGIYRQKMETAVQLARQEFIEKQNLLLKSGAGEKQAAEISKEMAADLKNAKTKALQDWESKLQSALLQAVTDERKYAAEVIKLQEDLRLARMSTEDKLRELRRRTMTEEQAWSDRQAQAYETLRQAKEAMRKGEAPEDLKAASDLAKKAQDQFAGLAGEVKNGDQVIKTEAETVRSATSGVQEAGKVIEDTIKKQMAITQESQKQRAEDIKQFSSELDEARGRIDLINNTPLAPVATFKADTREVNSEIERLNNTVTHSTHIIHVQKVEENSIGGLIARYADGGWNRIRGLLSGYGGGDRRRALLEDGEYVVRKEAVARYGAGFFEMLNGMRLDFAELFSFALPELPRAAYASGGIVAGSDYGTLRLQAGDVELPVLVPGPNGREMVRELEKALKKRGLTHVG